MEVDRKGWAHRVLHATGAEHDVAAKGAAILDLTRAGLVLEDPIDATTTLGVPAFDQKGVHTNDTPAVHHVCAAGGPIMDFPVAGF